MGVRGYSLLWPFFDFRYISDVQRRFAFLPFLEFLDVAGWIYIRVEEEQWTSIFYLQISPAPLHSSTPLLQLLATLKARLEQYILEYGQEEKIGRYRKRKREETRTYFPRRTSRLRDLWRECPAGVDERA